MAKIENASPFLYSEDDFFDLDHVTSMVEVASSARCGRSKLWLGAYPGEKVTLAHPQTSVHPVSTHDPTLWYESMQDMSGYILSDITLPPSDEQLDLSISTAQTENDFYVQNPGLPSPAQFILGDTNDDVISEDSNMFDNSHFEIPELTSKEYQFEPTFKEIVNDYMQTDQTRTTSTNMDEEEKNSLTNKVSFYRTKSKSVNFKNGKPKYLAIIDSEEPLIKEDPDLYCTQSKIDFDIKADVDVSDIFAQEPSWNLDTEVVYSPADFKDMGVAEEVVVTTEEEDKYKSNLNIPILDSVPTDPEDDLNIAEEKPKEECSFFFQSDPFTSIEAVMDDLFNDLGTTEDNLYGQIEDDYAPIITPDEIKEDYSARPSISPMKDMYTYTNNERLSPMDMQRRTNHQAPTLNIGTPSKQQPVIKHLLTLDIGAARATLLDDKGISDTPEILEALEPEVGKFDLIKFITTNGDPNNNAVSPVIETCTKEPKAPRKGKSHLSLLDLKQALKPGRKSLLLRIEDGREEEEEPLPSTSAASALKRPVRQSATRFKKRIKEGLLNSVEDSQSVSSDEEDDEPTSKRQRTTSTTSSRRRLNSDSDQSSISEDAMKYRERRDRNNLSSKRSRQKRKMNYVMKQKELKELETKNARLKLKAEQLGSVLTRVKTAWADYLAHMKDNDKDRGDEH